MEKIIKIGEKSVKIDSNMSWAAEYREQFGRDPIQDTLPLIGAVAETAASIVAGAGASDVGVEDVIASLEGKSVDLMAPLQMFEPLTVTQNVLWAMAKAADQSIDPPKEWISQFDEFPLDEIIPVLYDVITKTFVSSKNRKRLKSLIKTIQPLHSTQSSLQESNED